MNNNTAQNPQSDTNYVNDYKPPRIMSVSSNDPVEPVELDSSDLSASTTPIAPATPQATPTMSTSPAPQATPTTSSLDGLSTPDASPAPVVSSALVESSTPDRMSTPDASKKETSESLEDQNIFLMLGANDGPDNLKENFLNELQQVIWDDFLENDVELLITSDEKKEFDVLMKKKQEVESKTTDAVDNANKEASEEAQDNLIAYLETLIPDLEDLMLEKALDLKADLFSERIIGMRDYYSDSQDNLATIDKAEEMMREEKWHSAAKLLNGLATK